MPKFSAHSTVPFLSTPSARRATVVIRMMAAWSIISIHALCEEGDLLTRCIRQTLDTFLSTPSARRATVNCWIVYVLVSISIHALCEEGDVSPGRTSST